MQKTPLKRPSPGFTIIELLVVIAIISLLASIILVAMQAARARSRDGRRLQDTAQISKALEFYYNDNLGYPTSTDAGGTYSGTGVLFSNSLAIKGALLKYLSLLPVAQEPADGSCTDQVGTQTLNNSYWYLSDGPSAFAANYTLSFCLGSSSGSLPPGSHYIVNGTLR